MDVFFSFSEHFCGYALDVCSFHDVCCYYSGSYAFSTLKIEFEWFVFTAFHFSARISRKKARYGCRWLQNLFHTKSLKNALRSGQRKECVAKTSTFDAKLTNFCCKHFNTNKQFMDSLILSIWGFFSSFILTSLLSHFSRQFSLHQRAWFVFLYLRVALHFCGLSKIENKLVLSDAWAGKSVEMYCDAIFKSMQWIQRDDTCNVGNYKTTRKNPFKPWAAYKRWVPLFAKSVPKKSHSTNGRCIIT